MEKGTIQIHFHHRSSFHTAAYSQKDFQLIAGVLELFKWNVNNGFFILSPFSIIMNHPAAL